LGAWLHGRVFLPAFELGPHCVQDYVMAIRRSGARFLNGYASACYMLAVLVDQAGLDLSFESVFTTAEMIPDQWTERIARVFSARVLPYYGCVEVNSVGFSCPAAPVYHISDEHVIVEVEDVSGQTGLEGAGAFLITDLDNRAMPLIRYRNGDAGRVEGPGCPCGRTLGRVSRLDGRVSDMLVTTAGARISGAIVPHALRLIANVGSYQLIQRAPGQATVRIVRAPGYDRQAAEAELRRIFRQHLCAQADIEFEYVSSVPRTAAGKARFVINEYLAAQGEQSEPGDVARASPE
jgi:phenylacetate-CoA ligase